MDGNFELARIRRLPVDVLNAGALPVCLHIDINCALADVCALITDRALGALYMNIKIGSAALIVPHEKNVDCSSLATSLL